MKIAKQFVFDAAHFLPRVTEGHKCRRVHGHTYRVEIICRGDVGEDGMIIDYAEIDAAWAPVFELIDHRLLNEVPGLENPTTENLAPFIFRKLLEFTPINALPNLIVRVYESSATWCEFP